MDIDLQVKAIVGRELNLDVASITPRMAFYEDLGADSLDAVAIFLAIEEELGIQISDSQALQIKTVQEALDCVRECLSRNSASIN